MKNKKALIIPISLFIIVVISIGVFFVYTSDYYHTDTTTVEAVKIEDNIRVNTLDDGSVTAEPENIKAGLIFYPGGKVEHTAYIPLITKLAEKGIFCALVQMPFNLAILNEDKANEIRELYPDISSWYMCGHSLGGVCAADHIAKYRDSYMGLILLAAYSTKDISKIGLKVLSIYGSEDTVLNMEKYEANKTNLPVDLEERIIPGGCHSQFGYYGKQSGDGKALISTDEQINITADYIADFICSK